MNTELITELSLQKLIKYHTAHAKIWWGKTLANPSFQSFGRKMLVNLQHSKTNISNFRNQPGKIKVNGIHFAKFAKFLTANILCYTVTSYVAN